MAIETLTAVPDEFLAGDTVKITLSDSDFPASTWSGSLSFNGPAAFTVAAVADGDEFDYTIPAATTSAIASGVYSWAHTVTSGDERATIDSGNVWIRPNPTAAYNTWAYQCLTLLRAHILGRLPSGLTSHTINGSSISKMSLPEAVKLEAEFAAKVAMEERARLNTAHGEYGVRRIEFIR